MLRSVCPSAADTELLDVSTLETVTRGKPPATEYEHARNVRAANCHAMI